MERSNKGGFTSKVPHGLASLLPGIPTTTCSPVRYASGTSRLHRPTVGWRTTTQTTSSRMINGGIPLQRNLLQPLSLVNHMVTPSPPGLGNLRPSTGYVNGFAVALRNLVSSTGDTVLKPSSVLQVLFGGVSVRRNVSAFSNGIETVIKIPLRSNVESICFQLLDEADSTGAVLGEARIPLSLVTASSKMSLTRTFDLQPSSASVVGEISVLLTPVPQVTIETLTSYQHNINRPGPIGAALPVPFQGIPNVMSGSSIQGTQQQCISLHQQLLNQMNSHAMAAQHHLLLGAGMPQSIPPQLNDPTLPHWLRHPLQQHTDVQHWAPQQNQETFEQQQAAVNSMQPATPEPAYVVDQQACAPVEVTNANSMHYVAAVVVQEIIGIDSEDNVGLYYSVRRQGQEIHKSTVRLPTVETGGYEWATEVFELDLSQATQNDEIELVVQNSEFNIAARGSLSVTGFQDLVSAVKSTGRPEGQSLQIELERLTCGFGAVIALININVSPRAVDDRGLGSTEIIVPRGEETSSSPSWINNLPNGALLTAAAMPASDLWKDPEGNVYKSLVIRVRRANASLGAFKIPRLRCNFGFGAASNSSGPPYTPTGSADEWNCIVALPLEASEEATAVVEVENLDANGEVDEVLGNAAMNLDQGIRLILSGKQAQIAEQVKVEDFMRRTRCILDLEYKLSILPFDTVVGEPKTVADLPAQDSTAKQSLNTVNDVASFILKFVTLTISHITDEEALRCPERTQLLVELTNKAPGEIRQKPLVFPFLTCTGETSLSFARHRQFSELAGSDFEGLLPYKGEKFLRFVLQILPSDGDAERARTIVKSLWNILPETGSSPHLPSRCLKVLTMCTEKNQVASDRLNVVVEAVEPVKAVESVVIASREAEVTKKPFERLPPPTTWEVLGGFGTVNKTAQFGGAAESANVNHTFNPATLAAELGIISDNKLDDSLSTPAAQTSFGATTVGDAAPISSPLISGVLTDITITTTTKCDLPPKNEDQAPSPDVEVQQTGTTAIVQNQLDLTLTANNHGNTNAQCTEPGSLTFPPGTPSESSLGDVGSDYGQLFGYAYDTEFTSIKLHVISAKTASASVIKGRLLCYFKATLEPLNETIPGTDVNFDPESSPAFGDNQTESPQILTSHETAVVVATSQNFAVDELIELPYSREPKVKFEVFLVKRSSKTGRPSVTLWGEARSDLSVAILSHPHRCKQVLMFYAPRTTTACGNGSAQLGPLVLTANIATAFVESIPVPTPVPADMMDATVSSLSSLSGGIIPEDVKKSLQGIPTPLSSPVPIVASSSSPHASPSSPLSWAASILTEEPKDKVQLGSLIEKKSPPADWRSVTTVEAKTTDFVPAPGVLPAPNVQDEYLVTTNQAAESPGVIAKSEAPLPSESRRVLNETSFTTMDTNLVPDEPTQRMRILYNVMDGQLRLQKETPLEVPIEEKVNWTYVVEDGILLKAQEEPSSDKTETQEPALNSGIPDIGDSDDKLSNDSDCRSGSPAVLFARQSSDPPVAFDLPDSSCAVDPTPQLQILNSSNSSMGNTLHFDTKVVDSSDRANEAGGPAQGYCAGNGETEWRNMGTAEALDVTSVQFDNDVPDETPRAYLETARRSDVCDS